MLVFYGDKSPQWLSDLTHMETPWQTARRGLPDSEPGNTIIPKETLAEYYGSLLRRPWPKGLNKFLESCPGPLPTSNHAWGPTPQPLSIMIVNNLSGLGIVDMQGALGLANDSCQGLVE